MSNQTIRPSYLNQINYIYVISGIVCCLIIVGFVYIIGDSRLAWLSVLCCIIIIIIALYLIKTGRITTEFCSCISNSNYKILPDSIPECFSSTSNSNYYILPDPIPVHMLVAGETYQTHDTFRQRLKLQIEPCSAESSNIILVFCPVVSRIGTDMEATMARVTDDKPVIMVFMHHCHHPSHMTNITVQPSRSNIVQVVHCAFHETKGLLECQENEQAVAEVRTMLQKYHS